LDSKETLGQRERRELRVPVAYLDQREMLVKEDQWEFGDKQVLKVQLESLVLQEEEECLDQMDRWVLRVNLGIVVYKDILVQKENQEILVDLELQDFKVFVEFLEGGDQGELGVPWGSLVIQAQMERLANKVYRESQEDLVQWDLQETRVL